MSKPIKWNIPNYNPNGYNGGGGGYNPPPVPGHSPMWQCVTCETLNDKHRCFICNAPKPLYPVLPVDPEPTDIGGGNGGTVYRKPERETNPLIYGLAIGFFALLIIILLVALT